MTSLRAYYNEIDPYAAQWIRNLIAAGLVTAGEVDERSIVDVRPGDLDGFTRCHFFAGIAVWDYALALAGWPADRPVWTGSCPCQPFSAAGKGGRVSDERHLWPAFFHLIEQCRPATVLGEQVASKDGLDWLDLVQADLEAAAYDVAAADLCAAGVGAPHIRQRLWFVADAGGERRDGEPAQLWRSASARWNKADHAEAAGGGEACFVADADRLTRGQGGEIDGGRHTRGDAQQGAGSWRGGLSGILGDAEGWEQRDRAPQEGLRRKIEAGRPGPWSNPDWLPCRDGKARPVEPGTFPLAHGAPARVGRLRAYGNAIVAEAARTFIGAVMEARP